jgi:flagellar basal body-associated protein FliL
MSDEENVPKKGSSITKIAIWLVVALASIACGVATPLAIAKFGAESSPSELTLTPDPDAELDYIDFEEVIVNLREQQFSRFLKINVSLEVPKDQKMEIEKLVEARKAVLLDRINLHFSEVTTDDLKGKFGQNRIRREMHGYFNQILFDDGVELIRDILFRNLHVQ